MKPKILAAMVMMTACAAQATLYTFTFSSGFYNGGEIPDGNLSGWSDTRNIPDSFTLGPNDTSEIVDVNVRLTISGGYNGDLYGYLVHSTGFAVLLNRVGRTSGDSFGYGDSGMNITLNDQAAETTDIHLYQTVSGYSLVGGAHWRPDGRDEDPASVLDTDARTALMSSFNALSADGDWTLFLVDFVSGDTSTLLSWGLDIEVVPEPTTWALLIFGVAAGVFAVRGRLIRRPARV